MSVRVGGLWELGYNTPIMEADLWVFMLRCFNVDHFYVTPVSGIHASRITEYESVEAMLDASRQAGFTIVFCDERVDSELGEFEHPENAFYMLGRANYSPLLSHKEAGDLAIKIVTPANKGLLWPHQAAAIILYDRGKQWP